MSLGGGALAFEWIAEAEPPAFGREGAEPQIRIDPLREGRQSEAGRVAETSFVSGTCATASGFSPNAVGGSVLYTRVVSDCGFGGWQASSGFTAYTPRTNTWRTAQAGTGLITAVAQDHGVTYWISHLPGPPHPPVTASRCRSAGANAVCSTAGETTAACDPVHCTLMRTVGLRFGTPRHRPRPG